MSVSAPTPLTMRPPFDRRTGAPPGDAVPCGTALTWSSSSSAPLFARLSIALKVASTGPSPCESARFSTFFSVRTTEAWGFCPTPLAWFMVTSCQCSSVAAPASCATSCIRSSSKISAFLSARSLKRWNALLAASSLSSSMPSSFRRCLKALRPDSLPSTILLADPPTSSARDTYEIMRLEHAVLVDAGGVGERVRPDHRLVRLHHEPRDLRHQARRRHDMGGIDLRVQVEEILPRPHRHDDFLERGVAGALAQAVDGALDLARAAE